MKKCEKCGEFNDDTAAVCKNCGEVLPVTAAWAASLQRGAKQDTPSKPHETEKKQDSRSEPAPWGPTLAGMGLMLTLCAFLAGALNAGLLLSFGAALSVGAMVRLNAEQRQADWSWLAAIFSMICFIICVFVYIYNCGKMLYP